MVVIPWGLYLVPDVVGSCGGELFVKQGRKLQQVEADVERCCFQSFGLPGSTLDIVL
jgi:hypothetical protein